MRLLMSRLTRIFTVCLVNLIFIPIIKIYNKKGGCPNLADCPYLADCPKLTNFTLADCFAYCILAIFVHRPR